MNRVGLSAAVGLVLVLAVVFASAALRLPDVLQGAASLSTPIRLLHRVSASLAVIAVLALCFFSWREPRLRAGALYAFFLTMLLSALGATTGIAPPPWAVFGNLAGGLLLAGLLARLLGRTRSASAGTTDPVLARLLRTALGFAAAQAAFGALLAAQPAATGLFALMAHAAFGLATAAVCAGAGLALSTAVSPAPLARTGNWVLGLALAAPAAGAWSAVAAAPGATALLHPVLAASNISILAYTLGRLSDA